MARKRFDPSATYKVTKYFVEGGHKNHVGDIYEPPYNSTKRTFRHWVARRIDFAEEGTAPVVEEQPKQAEEAVEDSDVAEVVVDDGDDFQVVYKGVQFEINRNQIRDDGTLTAGALKAYKAAIA